MEEKLRKNFWWLLPVLFSGALYFNSLKGVFLWDDRAVVLENPAIKSWGSSVATFMPSYWVTDHPGAKGQYRPLRNLTFTMDYSLWRNRPFGYHFTNYALNLAAVFLLCLAAKELFGSELAGLLAGLIFAFHPMHAETVNFIKNRSDMLCLIFLLVSLRYYLKGRMWLSLLSYLPALLAKELAIAYPVLLFLAGREQSLAANARRAAPYMVPAAALLFLKLVFLRVPTSALVVDPALAGVGHFRLVVSTVIQYAYLLFFPFRLELDRRIGLLGGWGAPGLVVLLLAGGAIWAYFRWKPENGRAYAFSAAWTLFFLGPVSNIIPLYARPIAEQRLYVPSAGAAMLLSGLLAAVYVRRRRDAVILLGCLGCTLLVFGYKIVSRNELWANEVALWAQALRDNPSNMRAYDNLAASFLRAGDYESSERIYRKMLDKFPGVAAIHTNLGVMAQARGDVKTAVGYFGEAARLEPGNAEIRMNLGSMYFLSGDRAKARKLYLEAAALDPRSPGVYTNLGVLAAGEGKSREAAAYFKKAVELDPDQIEARMNLANAYKALGLRHESDLERAEAEARLKGGAQAPAYNPSVAFKKQH